MASGCPCIVADTGGLREIVSSREVGLRFRSRDPKSLARMVERVLTDDDLRDRLVTEASEHVLQFDWADVARQTIDVYAALLTTGSSPISAGPQAATSSDSSFAR
jgi:glycogen(starch) synthase